MITRRQLAYGVLALAALSLGAAPGVASASAWRQTDISSAVATIERAYYSRNVDGVEDAIATLDKTQARWRAWALWRFANMHPIDGVDRRTKKINEEIRGPLLAEAESLLADHTTAHPDDGEAFLILSQVYQSRITGMLSGMRHGRKAGETLGNAAVLSPTNPNVLCYQGINLIMAPGPFGDKDLGRQRLRQAVLRFRDASNTGDPTWGEPEAFAYLGLAFAREGDVARATEYYDEALALQPAYAWVKDQLIPDLQR